MASLCKLDFPIYACGSLDETHVIVAGGGGASKTGVPNAVDVLKLERIKRKCLANPCERLSTGDAAPMNMCVLQTKSNGDQGNKSYLLAIGLGGKCFIYSVAQSPPNSADDNQNDSTLRNRKSKPKVEKKTPNAASQTDKFVFNLLHELETDFSKDPLQKCVRISRDAKLLVTGGADGYVRTWDLESMKKVFFSHGHKDDVTDVDVSPDGRHIASVSRDGTAAIWNAKTGMKTRELHSMWNSQMATRKFRFRCCRYGTVVEDTKKYVLFTAHTPIQVNRRSNSKDQQCCLTKWSRKRKGGEESENTPLHPTVIQFTGKESISSMAVSPNGVFVGVGFMEGSVAIYIAFSLQCAKRVSNLHGIFVTGLTFTRDSAACRSVTGPCDTALVSVSADNTCKLTKLSTRMMFPIWVAILVSFFALVFTALYLHSVGII